MLIFQVCQCWSSTYSILQPQKCSLDVQGVTVLPPISHKTARVVKVTLPTPPSSLLYHYPALWLPLPNLGQTRPSSLRSKFFIVSPPLTHHEHVLSQLLLSPVLNQILVTADISHSRNPLSSNSHVGPVVFRNKSNSLGSLSTNAKPNSSINHIHADHS